MKTFTFIITTVVFVLLLSWIVMLPLNYLDDECTVKNGILVKTVNGYQCFDKKVLVKK